METAAPKPQTTKACDGSSQPVMASIETVSNAAAHTEHVITAIECA